MNSEATNLPTYAPGVLPRGFRDITTSFMAADGEPHHEDTRRGLVVRFHNQNRVARGECGAYAVMSTHPEDEAKVYELETNEWGEVLLFICNWSKTAPVLKRVSYLDMLAS